MKTNDDSIKWVVGRLQALNQEHEEARRANRVADHAACRIASESYLQDLLRAYTRLDEARAEIERLKAEVERLKAEIQPRIERSIAFQDAMEEAEAERDEARAEVERLREIRQFGCDCNDEDACRFARERDEARAEVMRLQAEVERLQGQVETRDIIIHQVAWQMQAIATAIGMTPEEQAASAEGIGDAIAERVTRLRAEVERLRDAAYRAGQVAMRERAAALCDDWEEATYCAGWREMEQGAQHCAEAIRALEVES